MLQYPPFVSWILVNSFSCFIVRVILSPFLSGLSAAGGLKNYKSNIISFLLLSGKDSGHVIVVII